MIVATCRILSSWSFQRGQIRQSYQLKRKVVPRLLGSYWGEERQEWLLRSPGGPVWNVPRPREWHHCAPSSAKQNCLLPVPMEEREHGKCSRRCTIFPTLDEVTPHTFPYSQSSIPDREYVPLLWQITTLKKLFHIEAFSTKKEDTFPCKLPHLPEHYAHVVERNPSWCSEEQNLWWSQLLDYKAKEKKSSI